MEGRMNRRKVLGVLAGAALSPLASSMAEARNDEVRTDRADADPRDLERSRERSAARILDGLWTNRDVRTFACSSYFGGSTDRAAIADQLIRESRMYLPSEAEHRAMEERYVAQLAELAATLKDGENGVFIDGDHQALHLVRAADTQLQLIKAYRISSSNEPWSNAPNSNGSPLGLHRIGTGRLGLLGEVLSGGSGVGHNYAYFNVREYGSMRRRPFIRTFGAHRDTAAEIITGAFMLVGPKTPPSRGIFIHGTNYPELLGKRASGGCIRLSSVDVYDLASHLKVSALRGPTSVEHGTPVMLAATEHVQDPNIPHPHRRNFFEEM